MNFTKHPLKLSNLLNENNSFQNVKKTILSKDKKNTIDISSSKLIENSQNNLIAFGKFSNKKKQKKEIVYYVPTIQHNKNSFLKGLDKLIVGEKFFLTAYTPENLSRSIQESETFDIRFLSRLPVLNKIFLTESDFNSKKIDKNFNINITKVQKNIENISKDTNIFLENIAEKINNFLTVPIFDLVDDQIGRFYLKYFLDGFTAIPLMDYGWQGFEAFSHDAEPFEEIVDESDDIYDFDDELVYDELNRSGSQYPVINVTQKEKLFQARHLNSVQDCLTDYFDTHRFHRIKSLLWPLKLKQLVINKFVAYNPYCFIQLDSEIEKNYTTHMGVRIDRIGGPKPLLNLNLLNSKGSLKSKFFLKWSLNPFLMQNNRFHYNTVQLTPFSEWWDVSSEIDMIDESPLGDIPTSELGDDYEVAQFRTIVGQNDPFEILQNNRRYIDFINLFGRSYKQLNGSEIEGYQNYWELETIPEYVETLLFVFPDPEIGRFYLEFVYQNFLRLTKLNSTDDPSVSILGIDYGGFTKKTWIQKIFGEMFYKLDLEKMNSDQLFDYLNNKNDFNNVIVIPIDISK